MALCRESSDRGRLPCVQSDSNKSWKDVNSLNSKRDRGKHSNGLLFLCFSLIQKTHHKCRAKSGGFLLQRTFREGCTSRPPWSEHSASLSDSELADLFSLQKDTSPRSKKTSEKSFLALVLVISSLLVFYAFFYARFVQNEDVFCCLLIAKCVICPRKCAICPSISPRHSVPLW